MTESCYYYFFDEGEAYDAVEDLGKFGIVCDNVRQSQCAITDEGEPLWIVEVTFPDKA